MLDTKHESQEDHDEQFLLTIPRGRRRGFYRDSERLLSVCIQKHMKIWKQTSTSIQDLVKGGFRHFTSHCGMSWQQVLVMIWLGKCSTYVGVGVPTDIQLKLYQLKLKSYRPHYDQQWTNTLDACIEFHSSQNVPRCCELEGVYLDVFRYILDHLNDPGVTARLDAKQHVLETLADSKNTSLYHFGPDGLETFFSNDETSSLIYHKCRLLNNFEQGDLSDIIPYVVQVQLLVRVHDSLQRKQSQNQIMSMRPTVLDHVKLLRVVQESVPNHGYQIFGVPKVFEQIPADIQFKKVDLEIDNYDGGSPVQCILDEYTLNFIVSK